MKVVWEDLARARIMRQRAASTTHVAAHAPESQRPSGMAARYHPCSSPPAPGCAAEQRCDTAPSPPPPAGSEPGRFKLARVCGQLADAEHDIQLSRRCAMRGAAPAGSSQPGPAALGAPSLAGPATRARSMRCIMYDACYRVPYHALALGAACAPRACSSAKQREAGRVSDQERPRVEFMRLQPPL